MPIKFMGFKTVEMYNQDKYRGKFRLASNGDRADVIFLYRSTSDMLVADTHYIQSATYSGYVHCNGAGCSLCAMRKNDGSPKYRKDSKLFIPLYNITNDSIEIWDRSIKFEPQLTRDVFTSYPNPAEIVFQIVRNGETNDVNTTYSIRAISKNSYMSYDDILTKYNAKFPDYYENIVKEFSNFELESMLSQPSSSSIAQDYVPVPRAGYQSSMPNTYVDVSSIVGNGTQPVPQSVPNVATQGTEDKPSDDGIPFSFDSDVEFDGDLANPEF